MFLYLDIMDSLDSIDNLDSINSVTTRTNTNFWYLGIGYSIDHIIHNTYILIYFIIDTFTFIYLDELLTVIDFTESRPVISLDIPNTSVYLKPEQSGYSNIYVTYLPT